MGTQRVDKSYFGLVFLTGLIFVFIVLGSYAGISPAVIISAVLVGALILGSVALWCYANKDADGSEWWQDDDASGWRGL